MFYIDTHVHTHPASQCSQLSPRELTALCKQAGLDGIVLTNHVYPAHLSKIGNTAQEQIQSYLAAFEQTRQAGAQVGLQVYFGVEVKLIGLPYFPEFLLFGITPEEFSRFFPLYDLNQQELFELCQKQNWLMIQSHPMRFEQGYVPADPAYMHGMELYNPHFPSRNEELLTLMKLRAGENFVYTAGSDTHARHEPGNAFTVLSACPEDEGQLRDLLRQTPLLLDRGRNRVYPK